MCNRKDLNQSWVNKKPTFNPWDQPWVNKR